MTPLQFDATTLRQQARPRELLLRFLPSGDVELLLTMARQAHGVTASGELGAAVSTSYVQLAPAQLLANSQIAVDPSDGFPRYRLRMETTGAGTQQVPGCAYNSLTGELEQFAAGQDWRQFLRDKEEAYMLQDRYFGVMCARENINIFDLLLAYARQADAAPSLFAVQA